MLRSRRPRTDGANVPGSHPSKLRGAMTIGHLLRGLFQGTIGRLRCNSIGGSESRSNCNRRNLDSQASWEFILRIFRFDFRSSLNRQGMTAVVLTALLALCAPGAHA